VIAVTLALATCVLVGWLVSAQVRSLAVTMPQYTANLKQRVRSVRDLGNNSVFDQLNQMAREVAAVWDEPESEGRPVDREAPPLKVEVENRPGWVGSLLPTVPWVFELAISAVFVVVLVVFTLLERENLRNRLIWLTGRTRIAMTTKALDETAHRISRYLQAQLAVNAGYGTATALGLAVIGVDQWLLWGFVAGLFRYLPYLGAPLAALFPFALSLAQFEGWWAPLAVALWFISLELVVANFIEPWLYGRRSGVSAVALLVAAAFWTFLWGPIGLMLSGPITVCMVVIGAYVPTLRFLSVLLGDQPALPPDMRLFQRLAASDQAEATEIVLTYVKTHPAERVYDDLLLPALVHVRTALAEGELNGQDEHDIVASMHMIMDEIEAGVPDAVAPPGRLSGSRHRVRIAVCAAHDELDHLTGTMLSRLMATHRWEITVLPASLLACEIVEELQNDPPAAICIGSLPPGGLAHTRYLCKQLRRRFPDVRLLAGRWIEASSADPRLDPLRHAGADMVSSTLLGAREQLTAWLAVFDHAPAETGFDQPTLAARS
jgi:predicted PurR-regulated permease PerM